MAEDYLPPVVTKLAGEIGDLLAKLTEAKAAIDAFNEETRKKSEAGGKKAGEAGATALLSEFEKQLAKATAATDKVGKLMAGEADKAGKSFVDTLAGWATKGADTLAKIPFVGGLFKGISSAFQNMPPEAQIAIAGGIAGAIAAGASFILAALNGVILGALGGGALALGIYNELDHPMVHAALTTFTHNVDVALGEATNSFGPALARNFAIASDGLSKFLEDLRPVMAELAPITTQLTTDLMQALQEFEPGFIAGLKGAEPVLQELGRDLPDLFQSFGTFWKSLADGSAGAAIGLRDLIHVFEAVVIATGWIIEAGSRTYQALHMLVAIPFDVAKGDWTGVVSNIRGVDLAAGKVATSIHDVAAAAQLAATAMDNYSQALDKALGISLTQDQANLKVKQDLIALKDSIDQNGRAWNDNTKEGQANIAALQQYVTDAESARLANIAGGTSATVAAEDYNAEVDKVLALAGDSGMLKSQLDKLKGRYEIDVNEIFKTQFLNEGTPPQDYHHGGAIGAVVAPGGAIRAAQGYLPPRSPGTLMLAGEPETDGEVLIPQRGISSRRAAALGAAAMAPYGLGVGPVGGGDSGGGRVDLHVHVMLPNGKDLTEVVFPDLMAKVGQRRRSFGNGGLAAAYNSAYPTGNTFGGGA